MHTRIWIDTEFNEFRGELISIGLVDEAGREFYEVLPEPLSGYGQWVAQHVVPILNKPPITLLELKARLHDFLAGYDGIHLIADWPEDIEHFLHLLIVGPGERIGPDRWTMEVRRDLPGTAETSRIPHNALEDAKALREGHRALESKQAPEWMGAMRELVNLLDTKMRRFAPLLAEGWFADDIYPALARARTALKDAAPPQAAPGAKIPENIAAIIERLHTQDNRATQNPLFAVQQKRVIGGLDVDYADKTTWISDGLEVGDEEAALLEAMHKAGEDAPKGFTRIGYVEKWEFVTGCLTEQGCIDFIACNGHNLKEPRIYAYSGHRNAEFIAVRKWLMSLLAAPPSTAPEAP